jgi:hypothetical protein
MLMLGERAKTAWPVETPSSVRGCVVRPRNLDYRPLKLHMSFYNGVRGQFADTLALHTPKLAWLKPGEALLWAGMAG